MLALALLSLLSCTSGDVADDSGVGGNDGDAGAGDAGAGDAGAGDGGAGDGGAGDGGSGEVHPGVLIVIADDLGVEASACYDQPVAERPPQPTIASLCDRGVVFDRVWSNPTCSPSRAGLQTGRYAWRTGVGESVGNDSPGLPLDEHTLPMSLDAAGLGHDHAVFGKWHLADNNNGGLDHPNLAGWNHFAGLLVGELEDYSDWPKTVDGVEERSTRYVTTDNVDDALAWIRRQDGPWVAWVAFTSPHIPLHLPPRDLHSYDDLPDDQASIDADPVPYFLAMIEAMDTEFGRLLDGLGSEQLAATDIVYFGDNGSFGKNNQDVYPDGHAKASLYQGGMHVPLVIAGPSVVDGGRRSDALVDLVDIYPTVLELAGVDVAATQPADKPLDGISLLPVLRDGNAEHARTVSLSEFWGPRTYYDLSGQTVTDGRFKLIRFRDGQEEAYDLVADYFETDNLLQSGLDSDARRALETLGGVLDTTPYPPE